MIFSEDSEARLQAAASSVEGEGRGCARRRACRRLPVSFEGEGNTFMNTHRGERPVAEEAALAG